MVACGVEIMDLNLEAFVVCRQTQGRRDLRSRPLRAHNCHARRNGRGAPIVPIQQATNPERQSEVQAAPRLVCVRGAPSELCYRRPKWYVSIATVMLMFRSGVGTTIQPKRLTRSKWSA